jgi:chromate reductase
VWAQAEVRKVLKASGAHVLESELPVGWPTARSTTTAPSRPRPVRPAADLVLDLVREVAPPVEQSA